MTPRIYRAALIFSLCSAFIIGCGEADYSDPQTTSNSTASSNGTQTSSSSNGTSGSNGTQTSNSTTSSNGQTSSNNGQTTSTTNTTTSTTNTTTTTTTTTACTVPEPERHRASGSQCDNERSNAEPNISESERDFADCFTHADCTGGTNGRCIGNSHDGYYCTYDACFGDNDCDGVCECSGGWRSDHNVCLNQGDCLTDSDCPETGWCSPTWGECGNYSGVSAYFCKTCKDECLNDSDCTDPNQPQGYCMYNSAAGYWTCSYSHCAG